MIKQQQQNSRENRIREVMESQAQNSDKNNTKHRQE